jgi:hypothetical protein
MHYERGALPGLSKRSYCVDGENQFLVLWVLESITNPSIAKIGLSKGKFLSFLSDFPQRLKFV